MFCIRRGHDGDWRCEFATAGHLALGQVAGANEHRGSSTRKHSGDALANTFASTRDCHNLAFHGEGHCFGCSAAAKRWPCRARGGCSEKKQKAAMYLSGIIFDRAMQPSATLSSRRCLRGLEVRRVPLSLLSARRTPPTSSGAGFGSHWHDFPPKFAYSPDSHDFGPKFEKEKVDLEKRTMVQENKSCAQ